MRFHKRANKTTLRVLTQLMLCALAITGCSNKNSTNNEPLTEGLITISGIKINTELATKSTQTKLVVDDLSLRIENTRAEILRTWDNIDDVPEIIKLTPGSYKLVAWKGDIELLPSFEEEYFEGEAKFSITGGQNLDIPITVKHAQTKINVDFDSESFDKEYSDYSIDIRTTTQSDPDRDFVTFYPTTTETANLLPGTIRLRLKLTSKQDNNEYEFYPTPIPNAAAAEIRTLKIKVVSTSGNNTLQITTEDGYKYEEDINFDLPGTVLPKAAPVINTNFFESGDIITGAQGVVPSTKYAGTITAKGGIKSVLVTTTNASLIEAWGTNQIDIVNATDAEKEKLTNAGFVWDNALNNPQTAALKIDRTEVSFFNAFGALNCADNEEYSDYYFEILVTDTHNQTNVNSETGDGEVNFTLRISK